MPEPKKYEQYVKHGFSAYRSNIPTEYKDRERQFLSGRNKAMNDRRAYLADDYMKALVQGLDPNDFYKYTKTKIRLADTTALSKLSSKRQDDFKEVLFRGPNIDYLPIGAKILTMGSTWIVTNPANISTPSPTVFVTRCNTSFNSFDDYGNIVTEPIYLIKDFMTGNEDLPKKNQELMGGYFNAVCQLNDNTRRLDHNKRFILGSKAYHITGFVDFIEEFSGNRESVHLLYFTCRLEEPTELDDVTENYIANGKNRTFEAEFELPQRIAQNAMIPIPTPTFLVDGKASEKPAHWSFESDDASVISVESNVLRANGVGDAVITAELKENPGVKASVSVTVESATEKFVEFVEVPNEITVSQFSERTVSARVVESGFPTTIDLVFSASGADERAYDLTQNVNNITVRCNAPSPTPLVITAAGGGVSASLTVNLVGY